MVHYPFKEGINRWLLPGLMLVASFALLVSGVPRFLHELMLIPGTPILERINAGGPATDVELTLLEKSRFDALDFINHPDAYTDLGSSYLMRARNATKSEIRLKYARMAVDASMKGLNMAPANTFAWLRVSVAHAILGPKQYDKALKAWRNSIALARFEPFILIQRVHLGTILYRNMTPDDIKLLRDQLKMACHWDSNKLKQYVQRHNLINWMTLLSHENKEMSQYLTER